MTPDESLEFSSHPIIPPEGLVRQAQEVECLLKHMGKALPPGSRLEKYLDIVYCFYEETGKNRRVRKGTTLKLVIQALMEVHQIYIILKHLASSAKPEELNPSITKLLDGQLLPEGELSGSQARDKQFELLIAALCSAAGYKVELAEPDIIIKSERGIFGIAVKRVKSVKSLEKNLRVARNQILDSGHDGLIALDISPLINRKNQVAIFASKEQSVEPIQRIVDHFVNKNRSKITSIVSNRTVFGILVHMMAPCIIGKKEVFGFSARFTVGNICDIDDPRCCILKALTRDLSRVLMAASTV